MYRAILISLWQMYTIFHLCAQDLSGVQVLLHYLTGGAESNIIKN